MEKALEKESRGISRSMELAGRRCQEDLFCLRCFTS